MRRECIELHMTRPNGHTVDEVELEKLVDWIRANLTLGIKFELDVATDGELEAYAGDASRHNAAERSRLLDAAWGIIANSFHGNWEEAPAEWIEAAERWRNDYTALAGSTDGRLQPGDEVVGDGGPVLRDGPEVPGGGPVPADRDGLGPDDGDGPVLPDHEHGEPSGELSGTSESDQ